MRLVAFTAFALVISMIGSSIDLHCLTAQAADSDGTTVLTMHDSSAVKAGPTAPSDERDSKSDLGNEDHFCHIAHTMSAILKQTPVETREPHSSFVSFDRFVALPPHHTSPLRPPAHFLA